MMLRCSTEKEWVYIYAAENPVKSLPNEAGALLSYAIDP